MFHVFFLAFFTVFTRFVHLVRRPLCNGRTDGPIVVCAATDERTDQSCCAERTDRPTMLPCNGRTDRPIVLPCNGQMDRPIVPLAMNILRTPHGGGCSLPADTEWSGRFLTAIASKRSPFSYQRMITGECRAYLAPAYSPGHALLHRFLRFRPLSLACRGDTVCNMHSLFLRAVMQRSWVRCVPLKLCAIWQTLIYMLIFLLLLLVVLPLPPC